MGRSGSSGIKLTSSVVESEVEGKADAEDTVYRTGIFSFVFLTAFPPLKLTTFKVLLALKSLRGGIMATNESGIDSCNQAFEHFWANYLLVTLLVGK